jgi:hypothetical protein
MVESADHAAALRKMHLDARPPRSLRHGRSRRDLFRVGQPLIAGSAVSQAIRAVVAADFCNGASPRWISASGPSSIADLTVSFARQRSAKWILLDGETWIGP